MAETLLDMVSHSGANAPQPMEEVSHSMHQLKIAKEDLSSEYVNESMYTKSGIILQFINNNCPGSTSMIGGMQLAIEEIDKMPVYLSKYKRQIKSHAVKALNRHMQCRLAATESLTLDDYGMSFAVATTHHASRILNPSNRNEGPLFYCLFPGMVQQAWLRTPSTEYDSVEDEGEQAYIINVHIHLLPASQRRSSDISKHREEKEAANNRGADQQIKRQKMNGHGKTVQHVQPTSKANSDQKLQVEITALKNQLSLLKGLVSSPPLPPTKPLVWPPRDTCPMLPDDL
jgi:hypothetical protein